MGGSISFVSTSQTVTSRPVCLLRIISVHMTIPSLGCGRTCAPTPTSLCLAARASRAETAGSLPLSQAPPQTASLTSNGARRTSPIPVRRRILRYAFMRTILTSVSTLSSAPSSPAATNCMSRVSKVRAGPLPRTSAMLTRQGQGLAVIPVLEGQRQRLHRQQHPRRLQRQHRPLHRVVERQLQHLPLRQEQRRDRDRPRILGQRHRKKAALRGIGDQRPVSELEKL